MESIVDKRIAASSLRTETRQATSLQLLFFLRQESFDEPRIEIPCTKLGIS
jgi:hypothetical protein